MIGLVRVDEYNLNFINKTFFLFKIMATQPNFKKLIKQELTGGELSHLKTAFDMVGDIAILEIDEELRHKEKLIAEMLLKCQKNIHTVLRKDSAHEGEFRTQKYKFLAGVDKRETIQVENKARLKLNVETVYYSPRMANERLRISKLVKPNEKILVMFSGCSPYICVIGKNAKPKEIVGVEINPEGHKYAVENTNLNKLKNVSLFCGDAREIVKSFTDRTIGLKTHFKQLDSRMKHKPKLLELHMFESDLKEDREEFLKTVAELSEQLELVLHAPFFWNGKPNSMVNTDVIDNTIELLKIMNEICKKYNCRYVTHMFQGSSTTNTSKETMDKILSEHKDEFMMIENSPVKEWDEEVAIEMSKKHGVGLCIDIAHLYQTRDDDESFYQKVQELYPLNPYFHIVDCDLYRYTVDKPHSLPIGEGDIDFSRIVPFIRKGIIEVKSKDEYIGKEMIESYNKYLKMLKDFTSFDRILMPLPRNAEDFLDVALSVARKGTIIHFYDFLHVDNLYLAEEKVKKACSKAKIKYKVIELVKCGQYSPRTYRVCLDFTVDM